MVTYTTLKTDKDTAKNIVRPKIFETDEHDIDTAQIDRDALYVLTKLAAAGYKAYLVGGGVRDLLRRSRPKDFDISTSAEPEEIKALFKRRCLLIGRRFRLAHIRFGHKVIEVSTFRSGDNDSDLIIRDNTWGTEEEDVIRRDFTINALFYEPTRHCIIDYVGGWEDIHKGILRTVGDAQIRFKQDPVRMLRLLKFRARFGFSVEEKTQEAMIHCADEIVKSSPARILEETLRMLESGAAAPFFQLMVDHGLLGKIFPLLTQHLQSATGERINRFLAIADQINAGDRSRPLDRSILVACLLFAPLEEKILELYPTGAEQPHLGDLIPVITSLIDEMFIHSLTRFPRRITTMVASILCNQYRFTPLSGKRHVRNKFLQHKEFPLALQFFKMRALLDKQLMDEYTSWKNAYNQSAKSKKSKS